MPARFDRSVALAALLAVCLPVVLYLPTLPYGFVFDDRPLLIENPIIASPRGLYEIFTTDLDPQAREHEAPSTNYLRPLFLAFAAGLHNLFGSQPFGWHLVTITLHGLLGGLGFWVLRREGLGLASALAASLLFSLHPSHVQSAAWVSGLQDLVFGLFALSAYLAYRTSAEQPRAHAGRLLTLGVSYALALLAKEPAVGLLLFVLAEILWVAPRTATRQEKPRRAWAELVILSLVTAGYFAYRLAVLGEIAHRFPTAPPLPVALASVPFAVLAYLRDTLFPLDLFLLHPARPVASALAPKALAALAGLLVLAALALWAIRRRPQLARPLLWFTAWLAPALALWAVNPEWMVMDRYLLVPSLALGWLLALHFPLENHADPKKSPTPWAAVLIVLLFAALSLRAMPAYRDEDRFWNAAIHADPGSSTAWAEWAKRRSEAGDLTAARDGLEKAIALDPRAQLPRLRRALLALRENDPRAAVAELENLIERNPSYLPAWRNLVVARDRAGDATGAREALDRALVRFPNDPLLWTHRAIVYRNEGRPEDALVAIRQAITLDPHDAALVMREALLLVDLDRRQEATEAARRGLTLDPSPEVRATLEPLAQ